MRRGRRAVALALLGLGLARPAAGLGAPTAGEPPCLRIVWLDPEGLLRFGTTTMREEVARIFAVEGVAVSWPVRPSERPGSAELLVLLRAAPPAEWGLGRNTMGVVADRTDPARRRIFVFLDRVRHTLGLGRPPRLPRPPESVAVGRAVGRVVAHEIVHALLVDHAHDAAGLMMFRLSGRSLRKQRLVLSPPVARAFLAASRRLVALDTDAGSAGPRRRGR